MLFILLVADQHIGLPLCDSLKQAELQLSAHERLNVQICPKSEQVRGSYLPQMQQKPCQASDTSLKIRLLDNFEAGKSFNENSILSLHSSSMLIFKRDIITSGRNLN